MRWDERQSKARRIPGYRTISNNVSPRNSYGTCADFYRQTGCRGTQKPSLDRRNPLICLVFTWSVQHYYAMLTPHNAPQWPIPLTLKDQMMAQRTPPYHVLPKITFTFKDPVVIGSAVNQDERRSPSSNPYARNFYRRSACGKRKQRARTLLPER